MGNALTKTGEIITRTNRQIFCNQRVGCLLVFLRYRHYIGKIWVRDTLWCDRALAFPKSKKINNDTKAIYHTL